MLGLIQRVFIWYTAAMPTHNTLVILTRDQKEFEADIRNLDLPDLEIIAPKNDAEIEESIGRATILLANPFLAASWLDQTTQLQWIQSTFAGVDALNAEQLRKDYLLTNVKEVYGEAITEYVFGYILYFFKELGENRAAQQRCEWTQRPYETLQGKVLSILGAGSIGKEIARAGKAFGMKTLGYRQSDKLVEHFDEIHTGNGLHDVLSQGDYIVNVLPNTKETTHIINNKTLSLMKSSSIFMNVGRGTAVDEEALIYALNEGGIAKAVLDVFQHEPLPADSPLWKTKNVYITPHVSGYILTKKVTQIFADNYKRFQAGEELRYQVDLTKGY